MFERKLNQVRFITGAVTTPIIFGTLTFVIVQSAIRKELMHQYKLIFLLIVMLYIEIGNILYEYYFSYRNINDGIYLTQSYYIKQMLLQQNLYLSPLTSWMFAWCYFQSATELLVTKMPKLISLLLQTVYILGTLGLLVQYFFTVTYMARFEYATVRL